MSYAVLLHVPSPIEVRPGAPEFDASLPHHTRFGQVLSERGWPIVAGGIIAGAADASTIRGGDVAAGSPVAGELQLWGYYVVDAPERAALEEVCAAELWEARNGSVEVRPLVELPAAAPA